MSREEKLKQLMGVLEVEKAVEEGSRALVESSLIELEDVEAVKQFLFDAITTNLTEFLNSCLSDAEIEHVISYFSNKELLDALAVYDQAYLQAMHKTEFALNRFLYEKDQMKQTRRVGKKDLN